MKLSGVEGPGKPLSWVMPTSFSRGMLQNRLLVVWVPKRKYGGRTSIGLYAPLASSRYPMLMLRLIAVRCGARFAIEHVRRTGRSNPLLGARGAP
jgi:hypothetical protein